MKAFRAEILELQLSGAGTAAEKARLSPASGVCGYLQAVRIKNERSPEVLYGSVCFGAPFCVEAVIQFLDGSNSMKRNLSIKRNITSFFRVVRNQDIPFF